MKEDPKGPLSFFDKYSINKYNTYMKIGITIQYKKGDSLFTNGIRQNVMNLAKVLMNSNMSHDVWVINVINKEEVPIQYEWNTSEIKTLEYHALDNQTLKSFDLIIVLAVVPPLKDMQLYRQLNPNGKIVSYKCGNNYLNLVEELMYNMNMPTSKEFGANIYDEIWHIPQQDFNNKYFYSTLYRTESILVPFVWDPMFVNNHANIFRSQGRVIEYTPKDGAKRVAMFEPNLSVMKNAIAPMLIVERLYHTNPELIDKMLVTNSTKLKENKEFVNFVKRGFDLFKDKKAFFDSRYPIVHYLSNYTDVVICHQWGNDLNYLYLDALYFGYPLVHNAKFIQDAGYFYSDFDYEQGAQELKKAIAEHDKNLEGYKKQNESALTRYLPTHKPMIEAYDKLIENLFASEKNYDQFKYNWKTNSYN